MRGVKNKPDRECLVPFAEIFSDTWFVNYESVHTNLQNYSWESNNNEVEEVAIRRALNI